MPQHKSAIKRVRQNKKRRERNRINRSRMRTAIKKVFAETDKTKAEVFLKDAVSLIDKLSVKGIIHKNTAGRKKSQLTTYFNNL